MSAATILYRRSGALFSSIGGVTTHEKGSNSITEKREAAMRIQDICGEFSWKLNKFLWFCLFLWQFGREKFVCLYDVGYLSSVDGNVVGICRVLFCFSHV